MFTHKVSLIIEPFLYYTHTAQEVSINQVSSHMTIFASSTVMQCLHLLQEFSCEGEFFWDHLELLTKSNILKDAKVYAGRECQIWEYV